MADDRKTRLRIISDGTPQGTKLLTEDGQMVRNVQLISWHLAIGGNARCVVEIYAMAADTIGLVEVEGSSMLEDPTAVPILNDPQQAPAGPGFEDILYACPVCGVRYDDPAIMCVGDDILGDHEPTRVVERKARDEPQGS